MTLVWGNEYVVLFKLDSLLKSDRCIFLVGSFMEANKEQQIRYTYKN